MREIVQGKIYKHFKGMHYEVLHIAFDSETNNDPEPKKIVVYKDVEIPDVIWVREYEMFNSPVDKVKYPDIEQEYRFEETDLLPFKGRQKTKRRTGVDKNARNKRG